MMKVTLKIALTLLILAIGCRKASGEKVPDNVVIEQQTQIYRIIPDKSGVKPAKVKHTEQNTYRTRRNSATAKALTVYNDDIRLDKATGGKATYGSATADWVFYDDSKGCMIEVVLKDKGSKGKATFERTFNDPTLLDRLVLGEIYEIENLDLTFEIPTEMMRRFEITTANVDADKVGRSITEKGGTTTVRFNFKDVPVSRREPHAPEAAHTMPTVYVKGMFENLDSLYKYLHSFIPETDPGAGEVRHRAKEITAGCSTDREKIDAVTDFVHKNIRYLAVENGRLGNAPDLASEVLRKRFGDCKGSAILLRDMLRAVGIDSRLVWIGTRRVPTDWTEFPARSSGNHMIACVVDGDSIHYIDGTATFTPYGELPVGIQGQQTLIEGAGVDEYIIGRVAILPSESNSCVISCSYQITPESNESFGKYSEILKGCYNTWLHNLIETESPKERENRLVRYVGGQMASVHGSNVKYSLGKYESSLEADLRSTAISHQVAGELYLTLNPFPMVPGGVIDLRDRHQPVRLNNRLAYSIVVEANIPDGYEVESIPQSLNIESAGLKATVESKVTDKIARTTLTYIITENDIPLEKIKEYNSAIEILSRLTSAKWVLRRSESN